MCWRCVRSAALPATSVHAHAGYVYGYTGPPATGATPCTQAGDPGISKAKVPAIHYTYGVINQRVMSQVVTWLRVQSANGVKKQGTSHEVIPQKT